MVYDRVERRLSEYRINHLRTYVCTKYTFKLSI